MIETAGDAVGRTLTKDEIASLSIDDRIRLIETIWDSIDPDQLPVPESHRRALDQSLHDVEQHEDEGRAWDEIRDELFPEE